MAQPQRRILRHRDRVRPVDRYGGRMTTIGLVMAGGHGERMHRSGLETPKPLVRIRGVTLLEWNLFALLGAGLTEIVVSVAAGSRRVADLALRRGRALATAAGAELSVLEERRPLGNIGCAGSLGDVADVVLAVFADNLTTLDLRALLERHSSSGAAMTLAVHDEPIRLPYGELTVVGDEVVAYVEKPERPTRICSAVAALGPPAIALLPGDRPTGLVDLFGALRTRGGKITAFLHKAPWMDVNDRAAVGRAEAFVAANAGSLERWTADPFPRVIACAVVHSPGGVLIHPASEGLGLPTMEALTESFRSGLLAGGPVVELDDLGPSGDEIVRYRLSGFRAAGEPPAPPAGLRWSAEAEVARRADVVPVLRRALAVLPRRRVEDFGGTA
jgi:CTP:molybdopterin cytidylyltransferase MocA